MQLHHQNLYNKLKEMDLSHFKIEISDKIEVPSNVKKNMRYVGTEFERVFTTILSQKFGLAAKSLDVRINKQIVNKQTEIAIYQTENVNKTNNFNLLDFIEDYKCISYSNLSFNEKAELELFIKKTLHNVNFNNFKPRRHILTKIKFVTGLGNLNGGGLYGEMDLLIDDKIIDIKTDTILKLNKDYIVQLLYYYFLLNYTKKFNNYSNSIINKLKINKICLYYVCFDLLIEFDVKKIFKDKNLIHEIENLIHDNFINYNFKLRENIHKVVFNSVINENYFENIIKESKENQFRLYISNIDLIFRLDFEKINQNDYKREFILQFIKINFSLLEQKNSNSISTENYDLILKHLVVSFRNANKKIRVKKVLNFKDKHIFMGLRTYFKMNKNLNILSNYKENFNKNVITNHIFKTSGDYYYQFYDIYINIKNSNIDDFNFFLNNWSLLYNQICDQKINNIIKETEFKILSDFILELLQFEAKPNNYFNAGIKDMLINIRQELTKNLITKKQYLEKQKLIFKLLKTI
ncbi:MAG: hypothetical protein EKK56_01290 [Flavobacteriaceae bacterium]|nr:MAG: hypothetical protein EKK56_01290 [Flavobacteriaceae bacterium]